MTVVINLYGSPSSGKSTCTAALFSAIKSPTIRKLYGIESDLTTTVETVSEVAKEWAWRGITITPEMQVSISQTQIEREEMLLGKVDVIITDSPVLIAPFYDHIYNDSKSTEMSVGMYRDKVLEDGHIIFNFMLKRCKPYDPEGRYETKEEADSIAEMMPVYLKQKWGVHCIDVDMAQPERTKFIFNEVFGE